MLITIVISKKQDYILFSIFPQTLIAANSSIAALVAFEAIRGSTTEAKKATVLITGLPVLLNGIGWYAKGPKTPPANI